MDLEIKPCKTRATYSVKPKKSVKLDLSKLKSYFKVKAETPIAAVIEVEGEEIIVHRYGELRFKTLRDYARIEKIAEKIYGAAK